SAFCLRVKKRNKRLALGELEALACALLSVLLAFLHSGIARQKPVLAQRRSELRVVTRDRPRQAHAYRACLSAHAAAMRRHDNIHLVGDIGELQRFDRVMLPRVIRKILLHRAAVNLELTRPRTQEHARHRLLAAPWSQKPCLCALDGRTSRSQRSSSKTPHSACSLRWVTAGRSDTTENRNVRNKFCDFAYSETACGFCPACRAKPAASR